MHFNLIIREYSLRKFFSFFIQNSIQKHHHRRTAQKSEIQIRYENLIKINRNMPVKS